MKTLSAKTVFFEFDELDQNENIIGTCKFVQATDLGFYFLRFSKNSDEVEMLRFASQEKLMRYKDEIFEITEVQ
jgi:hypothetical protein